MRRCPHFGGGIVVMRFIRGEGRTQGSLFPVTLDELVPADHVVRVIEAFVDRLEMAGLGAVAPRCPGPAVLATIRAICSSCT